MAKVLLLSLIFCLSYAIIAADDSTNVCGLNEANDLCGRMCEPTCANPKPNPRFCPGIQCTQLTASCRCKPGYFRTEEKDCVAQKDCP